MILFNMKHLRLLYLIKYSSLDEAIEMQNGAKQGLSLRYD